MMDLDRARILYKEVRDLSPFASEEWSESYDVDAGRAEICIADRLSGTVTPIAHILSACSHDDRVMMTKAPIYIAALLTLLKESFRRLEASTPDTRRAPSQQARDPDEHRYAKACAILSGKHDFRTYLTVVHGLEAVDGERVNTRVRTILNIQSRNELDEDPAARQRWFSLVRDYESWNRNRRATPP